MSATPEHETHLVDGWTITSYAGVVSRLQAKHPALRVSEIEAIVAREYEAFTGGRPIAVPVDVEYGAEEILLMDAADRLARG